MAGRTLVTGANGHIGCNVVRQLLEAGHEVTAFVRPRADLRGLLKLDIDYRRGDICDPEAVRAAVRGCRHVLHLAAVNDSRSSDPAQIRRTAIEGVENVLHAAADEGIERVVFTSSTEAVGVSTSPERLLDESHWNRNPELPHARAKLDSERRAWELAQRLGVDAVAINPSLVAGQYDFRITPSTRYLRGLLNGTALTGLGGINYVDVRDVALAHVRALERGERGERYIVAGESITLEQLGRTLTELTGIEISHIPAPRWIALNYLRTQESVSNLLGHEPAVTLAEGRSAVDRYAFYDTSKTAAAFDLQPRPLRDCLEHTVRWLVFMRALRTRTLARLRDHFPPERNWLP